MPTFISGQWQAFGTPYSGTIWRAANPPVDPYRTLADGTVALAGQDLRAVMQTANGTGGHPSNWAYATGGAYDSDRDRFVVTCSSGHSGGGSNEVNEFICATGLWEHRTDPTVELFVQKDHNWPTAICYNPANFTGPEGFLDINNHYPANVLAATGSGKKVYPNVRQQYGCITYMPAPFNKIWQRGGVAFWDPNHTCSTAWEYGVLTKQWQMQDAEGTFPGGTGFPGGACWDSTYNRVLFFDFNALFEYDPAKPAGSRVSRIWWTGGYFDANDETTAIWHPGLKRLYLFGGRTETGYGPRYFDFSTDRNNSANPIPFPWNLGAYPGAMGQQGQPILYDSLRDRFVYTPGDGTRTLIAINPATGATTDLTPSTGTTPPAIFILPDLGNNAQAYRRFFYSPTQDAYIFLINPDDASAFVFKPPAAAPNLAFTDLATATRTGNGDTSKGLPAGVNGAIVTVWGTNLGDSQGTSTITVGGVTPSAIYYWGRAIPPFAPATLYNGYQSLQCIIFQVASTTPTGAQSIVVSVGGLTSSGLSITITSTGAIKFAAPGGGGAGTYASPFPGIFSLVASLGQGDVGYIMGNLTEPTGAQIPNTSTFTADCAVVAYPGSVVQVGDATHGGFSVPNSGSGPHMVYSKVKAFGTNTTQAMNIQSNCRLVGCVINAPNGTGSLGAVGMDVFQAANNLVVYGNEFTNCGLDGSDSQYHTLYISGRRGVSNPITETGRDIGWNYFHDNIAVRAINCFNGVSIPGTVNNAIAGHLIHDNVIVNQQSSAILLGDGVMGSNSVYNNVVIRAGQSSSAAIVGGEGLDIRCNDPTGTGTAPAPVIHVTQNTFYQCGQAGAPSDSGILSIRTPGITMDVHNNIFSQAGTSFPYFATGGTQFLPDGNPAHWSNNLWFGAGGVPSGDSNSLAQDPIFTSTVSPLDLHLQSTSPAIARGTGLGTTLDLDGRQRSATTPDLGAYAFVGTVTPPPPSPPSLTALVPQSCTPGSPTFTLAVFGTASPGFLSGAQVFWDGQVRTTQLLTTQEVTITVPASDVATTGQHIVTATNPGSAVSNQLIFNVVLGPATLDLAWSGRLRDRVGPNEILAADGFFDGTFVATLHGTGGRTITALSLVMKTPANVTVGTWNTTPDGNFALGAAFSLDGVLLNNPDTSVNFTVADGGQWTMFASPFPVSGDTEFIAGNVATLTVTFVDNSTATQSVTITATNPTLTLLTPNSMGLNNPAFTLILTGTNFIQGSTVLWNGNSRATTFISNTIVEATVLATDLLPPPHTAQVSVRNPDSQTSNTLPFTTDFTRQTGTFVGTVM